MCVCPAKDYAEFLILLFPMLTCAEYEWWLVYLKTIIGQYLSKGL